MVIYPKNFTAAELACKHTHLEGVTQALIDTLQKVRDALGLPLQVTSGYRHPTHPAEVSKPKGSYSAHVMGIAVDIAIPPGQTARLLEIILSFPEIKGIGYSKESNFFHFDLRPTGKRIFWKYRSGIPTWWDGKLQ